MNEEYRRELVSAEKKSQDDYDKAIVSLSVSALGLTFAIVEKIGGESPSHVWAIASAWSLWSASITSVIISYFLSRMALRKAISQTDQNDFSEGAGGFSALATEFFNVLSGLFFIGGIVFLIIFTTNNLGAN